MSFFTFLPSVKARLGHFVQTPLGRAHYHHRGKGKSKELLVMLAGIGHDAAYWPEILDNVGSKVELIAIDLFGRGFTDAGRPPVNPDTYAQLVLEVLKALGLDKRQIVICGISFGGGIAAHLAATNANVCAAYLIVPAGIETTAGYAATIDLAKKVPRPIIDFFGVFVSMGTLFVKQAVLEHDVEPDYPTRSYRTWLYSFQDFILKPSYFRAYLLSIRNVPVGTSASNLHDSYKRLKRLGSKVGVVVAEKDNIIPAQAVTEFVKAELPKAKITQVPGGHEVQWDRPTELSGRICDFMKAVAA